MRLAVALVVLAACGDDHQKPPLKIPDSAGPDGVPCEYTSVCNPLTQAGCCAGYRCTWRLDALSPQYVGHIGCVPQGTADTGEACMYGAPGATGYDNCKGGLVCSDYRGGVGTCKQICDQQGGMPACDAQHVCMVQPGLFSTGDTTPAAAGLCDAACDPLADNDFDGSGSATKPGATCGSDPAIGCYGYPSFGTPPRTGFSCRADIHHDVAQPIGLRHRAQCTETTGCAAPGPTIYANSCNQGYLPLLRESSMISTAICVALCKPKNCYAGNCGTNDEDRLGEAPHRCMQPDRIGMFDTSADGEHCAFLWYLERDDQGSLLRSPWSDSLGFCYDHGKYGLPACASLPDGFGSSAQADGAADLGCVDTMHAMLPLQGKPPARHALDDLRPLYRRELKP